MKKSAFTALLLLAFLAPAVAQHHCDCDSIKNNKSFSGFCAEYIDHNWLIVKKEKGRLKRYVLYKNGKRQRYYDEYFDGTAIYKDNAAINFDAIQAPLLMDGVYEWRSKKGIVFDSFYYKDGRIIKRVTKDPIRKHKNMGRYISESAEFVYKDSSYAMHYVQENIKGTVVRNFVIRQDETGEWFRTYVGFKNTDKILTVAPEFMDFIVQSP